MTTVMAIHSNRGGVGKTLIAVNLAMAYAKRGVDVSLIDLDFRAPSLATLLAVDRPPLWVNAVLDGRGSIQDAVVDVAPQYGVEGRLLIGFADPSIEAIRTMVSKDRRWETRALRQLATALKELGEDDVEYILLDTSPGLLYASVNAVACSDIVLVVTTISPMDVEQTQRMMTTLYKAFDKPTYVLLNKVVPAFQWTDTEREAILQRFTATLHVPPLTAIPCCCDLIAAEQTKMYALDVPDHPFSKALYEVIELLA